MEASRRRFLLGAFGDPGHAFPVLALAEELVARGHVVAVETAEKWRVPVERIGASFLPSPEYRMGDREAPLQPYAAVARAVGDTREAVVGFAPDLVIHDILTLSPALVADLEAIPRVTLVPHVWPVTGPGDPPYGLGARPPRSVIGRLLWRMLEVPINRGVALGATEYDGLRRQLGLDPVGRAHGAQSERLVLVATYPQLEPERAWPDHVKVTGPLFWEPPADPVVPPGGEGPVVLIAPSTAQDPEHRLLLAALSGLGSIDGRVLATWNRRPLRTVPSLPVNTKLVEWLSYSQTMPQARVVVSHGGHGTIARTLQAGAIPVIVPMAGDQFENAARVDRARLGIVLPQRLLSPATLRLAVERALFSREIGHNVAAVSDWQRDHDGRRTAADLVERACDPQARTGER